MLRAIVCCAAALLCGCTDFGGPIGGSGGGNSPLPAQETRYQALEQRVADVTRKVENLNLAAQNQDLTRLESEVRSLRGDMEKLRYDLDTSEKRSRQLYQDIDHRIQKLENESRPARLSMEPKIANAPPVPASQEEESAYLQAFDQLKAGRYDDALGGFKGILEQWPQGRYAVNALYWSGEAYSAKHEYDSALQSFRSLLERFPASDKAPDALFKIGVAQIELKQMDQARASLQKVITDFPSSNAANLARTRLEQLK